MERTEQLRAELAALEAKLARREQLDAMLQSLLAEQMTLQAEAEQLRRRLEKEDHDVTRLEQASAAALLYTLLGKKEERLDKERQEAAAARLKYNAAAARLADCQARITAMQTERAALDTVGADYRRVFAALQDALRQTPGVCDRLAAAERRKAAAEAQLREIDEALAAGEGALRQADAVLDRLDAAAGWGTWDLVGGGLMADLAKYSNLDEAQNAALALQRQLSRFRTELADVAAAPALETVSVDGFLRFADYFFDNLITDWAVLSHIQDSRRSVETVRAQVEQLLAGLRAMRAARQEEKRRASAEITAIVAGTYK